LWEGISIMEIRMNRSEDKLTVEVIGRLDTLTSREFETKLEPELEGIKELIVDLKELKYISSAGLRVLLGAAKAMEGRGEMTVKNPSEEVMDVFILTGFDDVFKIE